MHIEATHTFVKLYKKLPAEVKEQTKKAIELLQSNPTHPSLGHKKMVGYDNVYEVRVSLQYRLTYEKIGEAAYLRKVGTHDLLKNP